MSRVRRKEPEQVVRLTAAERRWLAVHAWRRRWREEGTHALEVVSTRAGRLG